MHCRQFRARARDLPAKTLFRNGSPRLGPNGRLRQGFCRFAPPRRLGAARTGGLSLTPAPL
eukprot:7354734-Pyramimonas_sp.AAC.1